LDDFRRRVERHLDPPSGPQRLGVTGDFDFLSDEETAAVRPAAVLMAVIDRPQGASALLTLRPNTMADHAGQVALPGGKIDTIDANAIAAALREAEEEVGLSRDAVEIIGLGAPYITGTRYHITPVIGLVSGDFVAWPDPGEVAAVFEAPLGLLMNPSSYVMGEAMYRGKLRRYYEIRHAGQRIWGVTAGILRGLCDTLYADGAYGDL
jgi:8-oxo-dGTP pyrophosphatase MutT (NUDIX family)